MLTHNLVDGNFEEDAKVRWNLTVPLDVDSYSSNFVKKFRQLFKETGPGLCGDAYTVESKLQLFRERYPLYSEEQILQVTNAYLHNCLATDTFIMIADNFIEKRLSGLHAEQEDNAI